MSILVGFFGSACSNRNYDGEGKATIISPETFFMTEGEHTIKFTVGEQGIKVGGAIKARFPRRCIPHRGDPEKNNYLKISLSRKESDFEVRIRRRDDSLDGQPDKTVITVRITEKPLVKGDIIYLTIQRTTPIPYPNFLGITPAPYPAGSEVLPVASDVDGDGVFAFIGKSLIFTVPPGAPEKIHAYAPTTQRAGSRFDLKVAVLDVRNNLATAYTGTLVFTSSDPKAVLPEPYTFTKGDQGTKLFSVTLHTPGYQTVSLSDRNKGWSARSNPIDCKPEKLGERIWWGDIHSHSEISGDGLGSGSFKYAKEVAGLDFYSLTDHSCLARVPTIITEEEWNSTKQKTISFYQPGKFVTLLGYECSMSSPSGHYNVYFNCSNELIPEIPVFGESEVKNDVITLWKILDRRLPEGVEVITIPHHTGMVWLKNRFNAFVSFDKPYRNPEKRVAIEICSNHGASEKYDPENPLSYELRTLKKKPVSELIGHISKNGPHYAQDAWSRKLYLGTIASSDDHMAHPGVGNPLVAAYARELTRDSIFNAIKTRRTYATTGERIILNFSLNDRPMGSRIVSDKEKKLFIEARGTDLIEFVEILKWDFYKGAYDQDRHPIFITVLKKKINALSCRIDFIDKDYENDSMYYIRLKQLNKVRGLEVWAWSSPIWAESEVWVKLTRIIRES